MNEYIKKDDAIKALGERPPNWLNTHEEFQAEVDWDEHISAIKALAPADVVERKRGEWMSDKRQHFCSECRKKAKRIVVDIKLVDNYYCHKSEPITEYKFGEFLSDYCPNCGADMRGTDDE